MGTSTSSALGIQFPLAMTSDVDSAPVSVCKDHFILIVILMQTSIRPTGWRRSPRCRLYLREEGKVLDNAGTLLVENSDSQQGHASAQVLECQVESSALGQRPETPDFSVHFHQPSAKVDLGETLIGGDRVHLWGGKEKKNGGGEKGWESNLEHKIS